MKDEREEIAKAEGWIDGFFFGAIVGMIIFIILFYT